MKSSRHPQPNTLTRLRVWGIVFYDKSARFHKLEWLFAVIFLVAGISFALLTPPGQNPDEFNHVYRAMQLANGQVVADHSYDHGKQFVGGNISVNAVQFFKDWHTYDAFLNPAFTFNRSQEINQTKHLHEDRSKTMKVGFINTAVYPPTAYAPQIVAIWLSRIFNLPILYMVWLGRILGLITVTVMLFFSMRLIPIGKWALFIFALLPATISQSAAFSADGMTMAVMVLTITYILKLAFQATAPSKKQLAGILFLCALAAFMKPSYIPIIGLIISIPLINKPARRRINLWQYAGIAVLAIIPFALWLHEISFIKTVYTNFNLSADYATQKAFVEHRPLTYVHTLYRTFFTSDQADLLYKPLFGDFSWNSAPLPLIFIFAAIVNLVLSVLVRSPRDSRLQLTPTQRRLLRALTLGLFSMCALIIATTLYLTTTNVYQTTIVGIQGRYFAPILILLLLTFYGNQLQRQRTVKTAMVLMCLVIVIAGLVTADKHYYTLLPLYYTS